MSTEMKMAEQSMRERRTGSSELVEKLLTERTEMLILFCRTAGLEPYTNQNPAQSVLQEFCQLLVDYVAAGHFTLYDRILNGTERRQEVVKLAEALYPRIAETTEAVLAFNDKYDCGDHCDVLDSLAKDLSQLGEQLASRVEAEDQLIQALHIRD